jgi:hypothetical protein
MIDPLELAAARADIVAYLDTTDGAAGSATMQVTQRTKVRTTGGRTTYTEQDMGTFPVVVTSAPRQDVRMAPQVEAVTSVWVRVAWDVPVHNEDRVTLTYLETGEQVRLEVGAIIRRSFTVQQIIECKEIG